MTRLLNFVNTWIFQSVARYVCGWVGWIVSTKQRKWVSMHVKCLLTGNEVEYDVRCVRVIFLCACVLLGIGGVCSQCHTS